MHRCRLIYSMNRWAIALPRLIYLVSVGTCSSPPQTDSDTLTNITGTATGFVYIYRHSIAGNSFGIA